MKKNAHEPDPLALLNFDDAFPPTPKSMDDAIWRAAERIEQRDAALARYRKLGLMAAAILALAVGIGFAAVRLGGPRRDSVTPPRVSLAEVNPETFQVYASKDDPCFHIDPDCPRASARRVALVLITARAFEKKPCPTCCGS